MPEKNLKFYKKLYERAGYICAPEYVSGAMANSVSRLNVCTVSSIGAFDHDDWEGAQNIAVQTGPNNGLFVIDCDNPVAKAKLLNKPPPNVYSGVGNTITEKTICSGVTAWDELVKKYGSPVKQTNDNSPTYQVFEDSPSGGYHIFFKYDDRIAQIEGNKPMGDKVIKMVLPTGEHLTVDIDVKGIEKKITIEPSIKEHGGKAKFRTGEGYEELWNTDKEDLPELADWVIQLFTTRCIDEDYNIIDNPGAPVIDLKFTGFDENYEFGCLDIVSRKKRRSVVTSSGEYFDMLLYNVPRDYWTNYTKWIELMHCSQGFYCDGIKDDEAFEKFDELSKYFGGSSYSGDGNAKIWKDNLKSASKDENKKIKGLATLERIVRDYSPKTFEKIKYLYEVNYANPMAGAVKDLMGEDMDIAKVVVMMKRDSIKIVIPVKGPKMCFQWNYDKKYWESLDEHGISKQCLEVVRRFTNVVIGRLEKGFDWYNMYQAVLRPSKKPEEVTEEPAKRKPGRPKKNATPEDKESQELALQDKVLSKLRYNYSYLGKSATMEKLYKFYSVDLKDNEFEKKRNRGHQYLPIPGGRLINLTNGIIRDRTPDDLFTFEIEYEPAYKMKKNPINGHLDIVDKSMIADEDDPEYQIVDREMSKFMYEDEELKEYFQRTLGYCITGENNQKAVFIWNGAGYNGKSVVMRILEKVLSHWFIKPGDKSIIESQQNSTHTSGLYTLVDTRVTALAEIDRGTRINVKTLKSVSGKDKIVMAKKFGDHEQVDVFSKIIFHVNEVLDIDCDDAAMQKRLRYIPFKSTFVPAKDLPKIPTRGVYEANPDYDTEFVERHMGGFIAWFVRGAIKFYRDKGFGEVPAIVTEFNNEIIMKNDPIKMYLDPEYGCEMMTPDHNCAKDGKKCDCVKDNWVDKNKKRTYNGKLITDFTTPAAKNSIKTSHDIFNDFVSFCNVQKFSTTGWTQTRLETALVNASGGNILLNRTNTKGMCIYNIYKTAKQRREEALAAEEEEENKKTKNQGQLTLETK